MDTETITAITALWPLALVICGTILTLISIFIFRKQIRSLLETADFKLRVYKAEIEVRKRLAQQEQPQIEETKDIALEPPPEEEKPVELPKRESTGAVGEEEPAPEEAAAEMTMAEALREGKTEEAEQLFRKLQESTEDPAKRIGNEAHYCFLRYEYVGDTKSGGRDEFAD